MSRNSTNEVIASAENGSLSWETIARCALGYMSEDEVHDMAVTEGLIDDPEDDDDNDDDFPDVDEAQEWNDFDPDC